MRAQKRSSLSQRAAEGAERHHDLLDDLGPDWELGVQKNYPEVRCSLCNHDTRAGATGISEFRHVYVGEYPKGPRKGEPAVWKAFKTGSVYEDKFFSDDILGVWQGREKSPS